MYQYILSMYWYEHFRRVSSRVSGFQMNDSESDHDIQLDSVMPVFRVKPAARVTVGVSRPGPPGPGDSELSDFFSDESWNSVTVQ